MFGFSENYIFGKFDTFCKRLEKIAHMITTMQAYSAIGDVRIEGIDIIAVRYKTIVESVRKKQYDILDHRKSDFDVDYAEFLTQFEGLQAQIQSFVDSWFERNLTVSRQQHSCGRGWNDNIINLLQFNAFKLQQT